MHILSIIAFVIGGLLALFLDVEMSYTNRAGKKKKLVAVQNLLYLLIVSVWFLIGFNLWNAGM